MPSRAAFIAMANALRADPRLELGECRVGEPASEDVIEQVKRAVGGLPPGMAEFHREMDGFTLDWVARPEAGLGEGVRGRINLLPIARVFGDWEGAVWFAADGDTRFRAVNPFDLFASEACAAIRLPSRQPSTVWFHIFGEDSVDTRRSYAEYLEMVLASRGFWYWITALSPETRDNPEAVRFREAAPALFIDFDPGVFETAPGE